ncbi:hypothetical protein GCM10009744_58990 [Kribbella alba]|uniref:Uncharacterized protein n=1 Tax=Kribbella alba TaxID=190197 RepID=A0ABP4RPD4_9ACTN
MFKAPTTCPRSPLLVRAAPHPALHGPPAERHHHELRLSGLAIDEVGQVLDERLLELKKRSAVGVREEDQLGVWQVLLEDVRVDGGDDDVVVAIDYQGRLMDFLEIVEAASRGRSPLGRGREVGADRGVRDGDVSILGGAMAGLFRLAPAGRGSGSVQGGVG